VAKGGALGYMVIRSQNCLRETPVCIVKLFSDAWGSLAAVVEFFASC